MITYFLKIKLLSDTTFSRGDGVAGLIDQEVEHDAFGFPYLRGRTLKGLLREECDNLVAVLAVGRPPDWLEVANALFGIPGSDIDTIARMHVGDACLPEDLRQAVALQFEQEEYQGEKRMLTTADILSSLTTFRRQTSINPQNGAPTEGSLRSSRVILRNLCFCSQLILNPKPTDDLNKMMALFAASTLALRRIGSGRNRGRGHVQCTLWQGTQEVTPQHLRYFEQETKA
ncbi:RAMP superfamily protein [Tolypothrix campylonemoides VB511288]|nr:RAMP superfamily protein [Tolypothrix campylonemoides VB511288]